MKIRVDFVTNSSSSSFTMVRFQSEILDAWVAEHPQERLHSGTVTSDLDDILTSITMDVDSDGEGFEISDLADPIETLIRFLCGQIFDDYDDCEDDDGMEGKYGDLIAFIKKNRKKILKEANGFFFSATAFESEPATIGAMSFNAGETKFFIGDASDFEAFDALDVDPDAVWEYDETVVEAILAGEESHDDEDEDFDDEDDDF